MQASVSVSVYQGGAKDAVTNIVKRIWIFPEDPFANQKEWLKALNIRLFDPEKKTAEVFTEAEIPFEEIRNIDSFTEITNGILILAEGISLKDYRGLSEMMVNTAASGTHVLCLALAGGEIKMPGLGGVDLPQPGSMSFRRNDVISELDKRLDADAWPPDGKVAASCAKLKGERGPVVAEVQEGGDGWPWIEMNFGKKAGKPIRQAPLDFAQGKLVICGFGIIEKWNCGPTPRFLFAKLLEHMVGKETNETADEHR